MQSNVKIAIENALADYTDKIYGFRSLADLSGFLNHGKRYASSALHSFISNGRDLSKCFFYDVNRVPYRIIACDNGLFCYNSDFDFEDTTIYYYGSKLILRSCVDDTVHELDSYREAARFLKRNDAYFAGQFKERSTFITSSDGITYHIDQFKNKHLKVDPFVDKTNYSNAKGYARGEGIGGYMPGAKNTKLSPSAKRDKKANRKRITELLLKLDEQFNTLTEAEKHKAPEFFELQRLLGAKGSRGEWI